MEGLPCSGEGPIHNHVELQPSEAGIFQDRVNNILGRHVLKFVLNRSSKNAILTVLSFFPSLMIKNTYDNVFYIFSLALVHVEPLFPGVV